MTKWNQILGLNRDKMDRFFGERTRRSIQTTNDGPFSLKSGKSELVGGVGVDGQSQLELIAPPDFTFVIITFVLDIALTCNLLRLLYQ